MRLETHYLNERIELFEGVYDSTRAAELQAASRLYNRHLGPVTSVNLHRPGLLDLALYSSSCNHSPVSGLMRDLATRPAGAGPLVPGGGKGATPLQSVVGALGEAAERLLAVLHYQGVHPYLRFATYDQLVREGANALGPAELPLFAAEQYGRPGFHWVPFEPDTPLRWMEGSRLLTGEPVWVPAQLVLLYYERVPSEGAIGYPTTGGLAFHSDRRRAILHGLYEWAERDAINVGWSCRLPPRRVEIDIDRFLRERYGLRTRMCTPFLTGVRVFLNTLDTPFPVMTVIALDESRDDLAFLGGGGAWSRKERALAQALFEVGQCRTVLKTLEADPKRKIQPSSAPGDMDDFLDATVYYGYRRNWPLLDWYHQGATMAWEDVPSLDFGGLDEEWDGVMRWLERAGINPVLLSFDSACWPGVSVVKVLAPELTMAWVPSEPYLGHSRYYELPEKLGRAGRLGFCDLNDLPLPFP